MRAQYLWFNVCTVYCIRLITKEGEMYGESTGKYIFEEVKAAQRCNTSCHGNRVMLELNFSNIIEIGSNIVLDRSGNVRIKKKKVSQTSITLVFAEALLPSEGCGSVGWTRALSQTYQGSALPVFVGAAIVCELYKNVTCTRVFVSVCCCISFLWSFL